MADIGADTPLKPLQVASCTYRITLDPHAAQKVLSLRIVASREKKASATGLCAESRRTVIA